MKTLIALCLMFVGAYCMPSSDSDWEAFKMQHGKKYSSAGEESARQGIFHDNLNKINEHNQQSGQDYTLGINKYSDMSPDEFNSVMKGLKMPNKDVTSNDAPIHRVTRRATLPPSVDWRTKGYVTPVKDQGQCGSCWAFSTTGAVEGQTFAKTNVLTSLSEQNLVDCSTSYGNQGCNGGWMDYAFQYIIGNKGIDTETSYPYKAASGKCAFKSINVGATVTKFTDIPSTSEAALQSAVATVGPVSVAIDASDPSFQSYKSGVYGPKTCSSTSLDHAVLVVGYNLTGGYYIVKNSWGTSWGIFGYIYMSLNNNNTCGIATAASYPSV